MAQLLKLVKEENGIQHAEEALLLALLAVAITTFITNLGIAIGASLSDSTNVIEVPTG